MTATVGTLLDDAHTRTWDLCTRLADHDLAALVDEWLDWDQVAERLGRIRALVNNAGVVDRAQPVAEQSVARWRRMFDINVIGSMICAREAVRRMGTAHGGAGGSIVNLSSAAARLGSPNEYVDYAAAKAAIDAFTIGLAKEVAPQGIRVNSVHPGWMSAMRTSVSSADPEQRKKLNAEVPLKRSGTAEEAAQAVLFLASDDSSYVTGSELVVDGGLSAR